MENNEFEETQDTAAGAEQTEEQTGGHEETLEYWKAQALKHKAIAERKEKKLQEKAAIADSSKKVNTEQGSPTLEHMSLLAKGASIDEIKKAEQIAQLQGVSLIDAYNSDLAQGLFAQERQKAEANRNSLGASGGSAPAQRAKSVDNMTPEEHRAYAENLLRGAVNR